MEFIKRLILQFASKKLLGLGIGVGSLIMAHKLGVDLTNTEVLAIVAMVCGQEVAQGLVDVLNVFHKVADKTIKPKEETKPQ